LCENKNSTNIEIRQENKYSTLDELNSVRRGRNITKLDIVMSQRRA